MQFGLVGGEELGLLAATIGIPFLNSCDTDIEAMCHTSLCGIAKQPMRPRRCSLQPELARPRDSFASRMTDERWQGFCLPKVGEHHEIQIHFA